MSGPRYAALPGESIPMGSRPSSSKSPVPRERSSPSPARSESDGSEVTYRDNLDIEPFDEKGERFQDDPALEDGDQGYVVEPGRLRPRRKSRWILTVLVVIVGLAAGIGVLAGWGYSAPSYSVRSGNRHITLDHVFNGTFSPKSVTIDWVKQAPDGTFSVVDDGHNILLKHANNASASEILVDSSRVQDPMTGSPIHWSGWSLSADMEYVLFQTAYVKQWRHSGHAFYYVHRRSDSTTFPINPPTYPPVILKCQWSPVGHDLAYVSQNDLFVLPGEELERSDPRDPNAIRVTEDGSAVVFNGVPDWVYEEEVYQSDSAMWWSPNGETLAYLRMDEDQVRVYKLDYYNPALDAFKPNQYPQELDMRYPKPGTPNPLVSVHTFSLASYRGNQDVEQSKHTLSWPNQLVKEDQIISDMFWVHDDALMLVEVDRSSKKGSVVLFTDDSDDGLPVRKLGADGEQGDEGWIDPEHNVKSLIGWSSEGYLDIVPNNGFNHIALFSPLDSSTPIWLTSGEWEVTSIEGVNVDKGEVYFLAATPSIDRHLYSVKLPTDLDDFSPEMVSLTDTSLPGYHAASFSPGGGFYVLSYQGPGLPHQRLKDVSGDDDEGIDVLLEGNSALNASLAEFQRPIISRSTIMSDDYELNVLEIHPPNLDVSGRKKYPVLFRPYGGPASQTISDRFTRDWHSYLACEKGYIIVMVDGRGTGFKGRALRNPVRDNLGYWEAVDQIAAAAEIGRRNYVDNKRIGIWGWSYGGYLTLKTLEAGSGLFSLGIAVAPVTDYLLYDSIYTERYLSTPTSNPDGYHRAAVRNVTNFEGIDLAFAHGTGDDNVHFANTAALVDKLTQSHVRGWRMRIFTDSDHSISTREAYQELYIWMTSYLDEKWGKGGTVRHD